MFRIGNGPYWNGYLHDCLLRRHGVVGADTLNYNGQYNINSIHCHQLCNIHHYTNKIICDDLYTLHHIQVLI